MSDGNERWMLIRGRREPYVYPFASREDAETFALDHGLLDWRAQRHDDPDEDHQAVCARCRERWPCEHVRLDREARNIILRAQRTCARCDQLIGGTLICVRGGGELGEDVAYHGRKGACRNMARRELLRLGHHDAVARLDAEDEHRAQASAWTRAFKAGKAAGLSDDDARARARTATPLGQRDT